MKLKAEKLEMNVAAPAAGLINRFYEGPVELRPPAQPSCLLLCETENYDGASETVYHEWVLRQSRHRG